MGRDTIIEFNLESINLIYVGETQYVYNNTEFGELFSETNTRYNDTISVHQNQQHQYHVVNCIGYEIPCVEEKEQLKIVFSLKWIDLNYDNKEEKKSRKTKTEIQTTLSGIKMNSLYFRST